MSRKMLTQSFLIPSQLSIPSMRLTKFYKMSCIGQKYQRWITSRQNSSFRFSTLSSGEKKLPSNASKIIVLKDKDPRRWQKY